VVRVHVSRHTRRNGQEVRSYTQNRQSKDRSGGRPAVAATLAVTAVLAVGGGTTLIGIGSSGASVPSLPDFSIGNDAGKADSKTDSKTWEQKGIRYVERAVKSDASCVIASHGHVQQFLTQIPCRSLRRYILAGTDVSGDTGVVSLVKVTMYDKAQAVEFKHLLDRPASGDITPLGADILKRAGITFTGMHYASKLDGSTVIAAEAEPDGGPSTAASLKKMATAALGVPDK
jgi:hypothetical protein